jgi:dipeptidyl aminopeptidase/acylaminoacyl peptidase
VTRATAIAAALALPLVAAACHGTALEAAELPEEPIALLWRDTATARRNAERLEAQEPGAQLPRGGGEGVAHVDDITGYLRRLSGTPAPSGGPSAEEVAGRLALLDARSGTLSYVEGARRDAQPVARADAGRRLVFSQPDGDLRQLYAVNLASGEVQRLTRGPNAHARGCILPDGRLVASSAGPENGQIVSRIVVTQPGGGAPVALSRGPRDHSPACSPAGGAVVWVSRDAKGRDALVARAPLDAEPRPLGPGREPYFSHDGEWVLYAARLARRFQLFRIRPDGSGRSRLGESDLEEHQPALAPDGRVLVYVVHDGYHRRLYARRIDGSGERILTDAGEGESPIW